MSNITLRNAIEEWRKENSKIKETSTFIGDNTLANISSLIQLDTIKELQERKDIIQKEMIKLEEELKSIERKIKQLVPLKLEQSLAIKPTSFTLKILCFQTLWKNKTKTLPYEHNGQVVPDELK